MRRMKNLLFAAVLLCATVAPAASQSPESVVQGGTTGSTPCDCCIQCRLAEKEPVAGRVRKNGGACGECCRNCRKKLPVDADVPAEIVPEAPRGAGETSPRK